MIDLIVRGGPFMYPILICSAVALAIFLERIWVLRRKKVIPPHFSSRIEQLLKKKKLKEAIFLCQGDFSSIARTFLAGLRNARNGIWWIREAIQERGSREAAILEKRVGILATIAHLTPLLGLLGTVSGMIKTFSALSLQGAANPAPLARGIAEALITTATGLCVAIPTLVGHRFLKDKVNSLILEIEESSIKLVELITTYKKRSQNSDFENSVEE